MEKFEVKTDHCVQEDERVREGWEESIQSWADIDILMRYRVESDTIEM